MHLAHEATARFRMGGMTTAVVLPLFRIRPIFRRNTDFAEAICCVYAPAPVFASGPESACSTASLAVATDTNLLIPILAANRSLDLALWQPCVTCL